MENKNDTEQNQHIQSQQIAQQTAQQTQKQLVRKFELAVFEEDLESPQRWKKVHYDQPIIIEVTSPKELQDKLKLYTECGQMAKVIREIDPPTKEQITASLQQATQQIKPSMNQQLEVQQLCTMSPVQSVRQDLPSQVAAQHIQPTQPTQTRKPKYYKVGDIDIKDDNGKIYQKQWMKLTDTEAANFRLVNDKNNAIVNMNGKHLEMKKWILVQNSDEDESTQLEENMNS